MSTPIYQQIQDNYQVGGLGKAFRDVLGWDVKADQVETFVLKDLQVTGLKVASMLSSIAVFEFDFSETERVPPHLQTEISRAVGTRYVEHLLIIKTRKGNTWLWPKKTAGGSLTHEKILVPTGQLPLFLAQRLAGLRYSAKEMLDGVSASSLRERLRGSFDTGTVTKKFYERFKLQHSKLTASIGGLTTEETSSYATLLLNRLMFIFFLQKKEFLNDDPYYLQTCMAKLQVLSSEDKFYSFYKDLLLKLFFDVLNSENRTFQTREIADIIGNIPYVNGGIFGESEVEASNEIDIPDSIFSEIFEFFESFTWHLDTRPTGKSDEINPEVIGYIFEQYINFTVSGKKENGAYYTKQDVTGYMVGQTLVPRILDLLVARGLSPLNTLPASGDRYIYDSLLHGWDAESNQWLPVNGDLQAAWEGDPTGWKLLDDEGPDTSICLPGESYVEMFHRRDRVQALRVKIAAGEVGEVNDLITLNLNSQQILLDAIRDFDDKADIENFWSDLSNISVIDPTCGSGAFLFAALEVLEDIYSAALDAAENMAHVSDFAASLMFEVNTHPSRRYFIRKRAAISNLYGTDLMPDAIETAKLRVFLALASCLDSSSEIEPLPDLDFNFKSGNLIVGIKDLDDIERISEGDLTSRLELAAVEPLIENYAALYAEFVHSAVDGSGATQEEKSVLLQINQEIRSACDQALARLLFIPADAQVNWLLEKRPFHWFAEFPQVMQRGGFDVVIGNPPYVQRKDTDPSDFRGYSTSAAPDLFAVCYERSLSLLAPSGRHAFIVMLNLAFSSGFNSLRELISDRKEAEWWSTYGKRPDSLFTGVQVCNTILILGPGRGTFSTSQQIFTKPSRLSMFKGIEYFQLNRQASVIPFRAGIANELVEIVAKSRLLTPAAPSIKKIFLRQTGRYWFPALPAVPRILSKEKQLTPELDPGVPAINLFEDENEFVALGVLAGKLGYLWWSATGDDFHTKVSEAEQPRILALQAGASKKLEGLALETIQAGYTATFASFNAGWYQSNIRWGALRKHTDEFDLHLMRLLEIEHLWRPLNIWYRQVMKSTGENANGFNVPEDLARELFQAN